MDRISGVMDFVLVAGFQEQLLEGWSIIYSYARCLLDATKSLKAVLQ